MFRLAALWGLAGVQIASACPTLDNAVPLASKDGASPKAYVSYQGPPVSEPFDVTVQFCGAKPLADLRFDAVMPAHQHGMNYQPDVKAIDAQTYQVTNVVFHMPGRWEMRIAAEVSGTRFKYTGEVSVE